MNPYLKTIAALLGALGTWGITASADGHYSHPELWGSLLALATAFGVYVTPYHRPTSETRTYQGPTTGNPLRSEFRPTDMSEQGYGEVNLIIGVLSIALLVLAVVCLQ